MILAIPYNIKYNCMEYNWRNFLMAIRGFYNYPLSWKPEREKLTRPLYLSLARQLKEDIASGRLAPGTRLPP